MGFGLSSVALLKSFLFSFNIWCSEKDVEIDLFDSINFGRCLYFTKSYTNLHGTSMFAVKAKDFGVLYNQSSSIAFYETSSYWSAAKNS